MKARDAIAAASLALLLAGCESFSADGGMGSVAAGARERLGKDVAKLRTEEDAVLARRRVDALLAEPLDADAAVQVALLNNRGLQAAFNDLGLSEAAFVQASLPPNPGVSLSRIAGSGVVEIEVRLLTNLLALFTLPARRDIAREQFVQAQHRASEAVYRLAAETRRAHIRAVAANDRAALVERARFAADAAARLMTKLGETGAATKLDQARVGAYYAELSGQLATARLAARREREALTRLMGLWGNDAGFRLRPGLDPLPRAAEEIGDVEERAVRDRADLAAARREVVAMTRSLKLTDATRYVSVAELSGMRKSDKEEGSPRSTQVGPELELQIPIFDTGEARKRSAEETYMRAVNRLAERAVNARSEARAAYDAYRGAFDVARHYQTRVLPLRRTISDELLLRYNGMLVDVFDLLLDARERANADIGALDARRDFHLAAVDLRAALIGGGVSTDAASAGAAAPTAGAPAGGH